MRSDVCLPTNSLCACLYDSLSLSSDRLIIYHSSSVMKLLQAHAPLPYCIVLVLISWDRKWHIRVYIGLYIILISSVCVLEGLNEGCEVYPSINVWLLSKMLLGLKKGAHAPTCD